jgi:hypothetical protein
MAFSRPNRTVESGKTAHAKSVRLRQKNLNKAMTKLLKNYPPPVKR